MGGQRHAPTALTPGKIRYPLCRRLSGPQGRFGRVRKISPPNGIRYPDRPAHSESLYRLSYAGSRFGLSMKSSPLIHFAKICVHDTNRLLHKPCWRRTFASGSVNFPVITGIHFFQKSTGIVVVIFVANSEDACVSKVKQMDVYFDKILRFKGCNFLFYQQNVQFSGAPLSERTGGSDNIVPIVFRSRVHWCAVLCLAFSLHSVYFVFRWHYLAIPAVQSLSETAWNTSKLESETLNFGVHDFQILSLPSMFPWVLTAQNNSFKH